MRLIAIVTNVTSLLRSDTPILAFECHNVPCHAGHPTSAAGRSTTSEAEKMFICNKTSPNAWPEALT